MTYRRVTQPQADHHQSLWNNSIGFFVYLYILLPYSASLVVDPHFPESSCTYFSACALISLFHSSKSAQMVFTTHNTHLLDMTPSAKTRFSLSTSATTVLPTFIHCLTTMISARRWILKKHTFRDVLTPCRISMNLKTSDHGTKSKITILFISLIIIGV